MSRVSRLGERFLELGEFDFLYVVTFKLTFRKCIYQVLEQLDKLEQPCLDLYFVIQRIDVRREEKDQPIFVGAFEFGSDVKVLQEQLQGIYSMQVMSLEVMTVGGLFEAMSAVSYREYQMFERLRFGTFFSRSSTHNPFAHAVLARDVLLINNLAQQQAFCHSEYTRYIRSKQHKNAFRSAYQKEIQIALYGQISRHYQIYLSPQDMQWMKIRQRFEDSKMEDCLSTSSNEGMHESNSSSGVESYSSGESEEANESEDCEMEVIEKFESLHIRGGKSMLAGYDSEDELGFRNGLNQQH